MKISKRIILIGNKGSFFNEARTYLSEIHDVISYPSESLFIQDNTYDLTFNKSFLDIFKSTDTIEALVFIGGEVRDKDIMFFENYNKPLMLAKLSQDRKIKFIYLSSLSVYDGIKKTKSRYISSAAKELPASVYGKSKLKFDNEISLMRKKGLKSFTIRPASIVGSQRMNSSIEKITFIAARFPILRYFYFDGLISYITRNELYAFISNCIRCNYKYGKYLAANNCSISEIIWAVQNKPTFIIPTLKILIFFNYFLSFFRIYSVSNIVNKIKYKTDLQVESLNHEENLKNIIRNTKINLGHIK